MNRSDPYDAEAALARVRPRLAAARSRRRRLLAASSAVLLLSAGTAAAALIPEGGGGSVVVATPERDESDSTVTVPPLSELPAQEDPAPAPQRDPEPVAPQHGPAAPPTTAKEVEPPPPPPPPPPAPAEAPRVEHTFTYPGTGSLTVSFDGSKLGYVSSSVEPGWAERSVKDTPELVAVEFGSGNVQRWIKVRVVAGEPTAALHEHTRCLPPPGTSTHHAPEGAGTVTVAVDPVDGGLSLVEVLAAEGWSHEVLRQDRDAVKVRFRHEDGRKLWLMVKADGCELEVVSG